MKTTEELAKQAGVDIMQHEWQWSYKWPASLEALERFRELAVAEERERRPDRYALGDAILRAWKKHGQDSWCSIADDVLREFGPSPEGKRPAQGTDAGPV